MKFKVPDGYEALNLADEARMERLITEANDVELRALGNMFEAVHAVVCGYCQRVVDEFTRREQAQGQGCHTPAPLSGAAHLAKALAAFDTAMKPKVDGAFHVPGDNKIH